MHIFSTALAQFLFPQPLVLSCYYRLTTFKDKFCTFNKHKITREYKFGGNVTYENKTKHHYERKRAL